MNQWKASLLDFPILLNFYRLTLKEVMLKLGMFGDPGDIFKNIITHVTLKNKGEKC